MLATANRLAVRSRAAAPRAFARANTVRCMAATKITEGVEFDTIAREWRLKWSPDNDKKALADVQKVLDKYKGEIKKVAGVKSVQRVVCGGCMDYKVVVALDGGKWGDWEKAKFAPEEAFLKDVKAIKGVSVVETQTYTLMPVN